MSKPASAGGAGYTKSSVVELFYSVAKLRNTMLKVGLFEDAVMLVNVMAILVHHTESMSGEPVNWTVEASRHHCD